MVRVRSFAIMMAILLFAACARKDIRRDMATLDRSLIPALSFARDQKPAEAKTAMSVLSREWSWFRGRYRGFRTKDPQWSDDFDHFGKLIAEADWAIGTTGDLSVAQGRLRVFRGLLRELRRRDSIDYFLDYLLDFNGPMEEIVLAFRNRTPESMPDDLPGAMLGLLPTTRDYWNRVKQAKFDPGVFGFDQKKTAELQDCIKAVSAQLDQLEQSLDRSDKAQVIAVASQLEASFTQLYRLFGDFPRSR